MRISHIKLFAMLLAAIVVAACESQTYESGDSSYSYMQADLCEAATEADCTVSRIVLDNGKEWTLAATVEATWLLRPDTLYRALAYYNKVETASGEDRLEIVSMQPVAVTRPIKRVSADEMATDPVEVVSVWKGSNGKYLNLRLLLKTGSTDDDTAGQTLALVETGRTTTESGTMSHLKLYHNQGDVPQYYSQTTIFSMPMAAVDADSLTLSIETEDGTFERKFSCKQ